MGLDIYAGMLYGTTSSNILKYFVDRVEIPTYDRFTGKLTDKKEIRRVEMVTFLVDIFNFKSGETTTVKEFLGQMNDLRDQYEEQGKDFYFIVADSCEYFGFSLNKNTPTYNCPQDWVDEYEEDLSAIEDWNRVFPNIPARKFIYVRASY